MPPEVILAGHGLPRLAARLGTLGAHRVLILASPSRRFVDEVATALRAFDPAVFDRARVHVPAAIVEEAERALVETAADTIVAVGGGSAIGLGKALRLTHDLRFAAVPTTYSGSEMTSMFGITRESKKITGRDARVRPDVVLYDPALTATLPIALTIQSLTNALAHVVSILSTGSLAGDDRARALDAAALLVQSMEDLLGAPADAGARARALRGAAAAGSAFDRGKPGPQHALAHLLGGGLGLPHAALHSVLLPCFIAHVRARDAELVGEIERAAGRTDLETQLRDSLARAGAPTSLGALGVDPDAARRLLATRPELPAEIVDAALR